MRISDGSSDVCSSDLGDWRGDTKAIAIAAAGNGADATDFHAQPLPSDDDVESDNQAGSRRWTHVLVVAIIVTFIGFGLIAYLWPAFPLTVLAGIICSSIVSRAKGSTSTCKKMRP